MNFNIGDKVVRAMHRKSAGWFWYEQIVTVKSIIIRSEGLRYLEFEEVSGDHPESFFRPFTIGKFDLPLTP